MTLTFNPRRATVMTRTGQRSVNVEKLTRKQTDGRTDTSYRLALPATAAGIISAKYCYRRVCVSVCLSDRRSYIENHTSKLYKI